MTPNPDAVTPLSGCVSRFDRRQLLKGAGALASTAMFPALGCGTNFAARATATASTFSIAASNTFNQPVPPGSTAQANLNVTSTVAGVIGPQFMGLSYEKECMQEPKLFVASNANMIAMFKRLSTNGVLRIGGNSVDEQTWMPAGSGRATGQIAPVDVQNFAAFVKATGWQCLYGINLGGFAKGSTTPALAAEEVAYVAGRLGSSLLGIEIGNEPDDYGDSGMYYAGRWSLADFESLWGEFRSAIIAKTPSAKVTGPATASSEKNWTIPFGQTVAPKGEIATLTQHYYRANGQLATSTAAALIAPDPTLTSYLSLLKNASSSLGIPFRISECNSFYNGGAYGVSNSYASSLWAVDYLFDCAQGGASGVNFHGGWDSPGYTPIADHNGVVEDARPVFYGMLLFTLAGQGQLYSTQLSAGALNVTAYAVNTNSGGLNIVIVNKDDTYNLKIGITLPRHLNSASLVEMTQLTPGATAPELSATGNVTIQGAVVDLDGTFLPGSPYSLAVEQQQVSCYVPALSAVLIQTE